MISYVGKPTFLTEFPALEFKKTNFFHQDRGGTKRKVCSAWDHITLTSVSSEIFSLFVALQLRKKKHYVLSYPFCQLYSYCCVLKIENERYVHPFKSFVCEGCQRAV